jgi:hypothetical protein
MNGNEKLLQNAVRSTAIHTGIGQGNNIGAVASNTALSLYVKKPLKNLLSGGSSSRENFKLTIPSSPGLL